MKVWKVRHYLYLLIYLVSLVSSAPQLLKAHAMPIMPIPIHHDRMFFSGCNFVDDCSKKAIDVALFTQLTANNSSEIQQTILKIMGIT